MKRRLSWAFGGGLMLLLVGCSDTVSSPVDAPAGVDLAAPPSPTTGTSPAPGPTAPPPARAAVHSTIIADEAEAFRFLTAATFGASQSEMEALVGQDAADWLALQFQQPETRVLPDLVAARDAGEEPNRRAYSLRVWENFMTANDQVRQRMVFALSQILVVSDRSNGGRLSMPYYVDVLGANAFGNYRDLLTDVTYAPMMGEYLTYLRNRKGDPKSGRMPDENYSRELLQLFTIGLVELNRNGTPKRGVSGDIRETYTTEDVEGLARVFTGLSFVDSNFWKLHQSPDGWHQPMVMFDDYHSELEKSFLGTTIPAGTGGDETIARALDHIFAHDNVAPFISRQLIQRFTQSNPDPAYVERVAYAFEEGRFVAPHGQVFGTGERGDLQATLAAILLDQTVMAPETTPANYRGKIREPVLKFVQWARAFEVSDVDADNDWWLWDTSDPTKRLGQNPFRSPSVFNFYRPGYIAPGTESGAEGRTAPEFQVVNESTTVAYSNFMLRYIWDDAPRKDRDYRTISPDYSAQLALADDTDALIDNLDLLLTGGRLSDMMKDDMRYVLNNRPVEDKDPDNDRLTRVRIAVLMVVGSPAYAISE